MPYVTINTNLELDSDKQSQLALDASNAVAGMLGKPENYVMTQVNTGQTMSFAGSTEPLAYIELKSIGLPDNKTSNFSEQLCELISQQTGIDSSRVYIEFANAERHMWGWNSGTF